MHMREILTDVLLWNVKHAQTKRLENNASSHYRIILCPREQWIALLPVKLWHYNHIKHGCQPIGRFKTKPLTLQHNLGTKIGTDQRPRPDFSSDCRQGWFGDKPAQNSCSVSPALTSFYWHKRQVKLTCDVVVFLQYQSCFCSVLSGSRFYCLSLMASYTYCI